MTLAETRLEGLPLLHRGKVRETYDLGGGKLLLVATDRVSVYDAVLPTLIPDKGRVLSGVSRYWFERLGAGVPNHYITDGRDGWPPELAPYAELLDGRAMIVRRAKRLPYEFVVRGYLAGTGWEEYRERGTLAGEPLPPGLREGDELPEPRLTPARKNESGHDENISLEVLQRDLGEQLLGYVLELCMRLYGLGRDQASWGGLMLADTKLEFGLVDGELTLIDEVLTPDSSRYWLADEYRPGGPQPSLDKQYVRDWVAASGWDRVSPPPELPPAVVEGARSRYLEAYRRITGEELHS